MRLEQENDDLAYELVTSKIALRNDLDNVSVGLVRLRLNSRAVWKTSARHVASQCFIPDPVCNLVFRGLTALSDV